LPENTGCITAKSIVEWQRWITTGSALAEHKISASSPKPDIYAHNPVQDALVLTKSASSKATSVCPHLPLINSRSGFCRTGHSTAHYHFAYRSRLGFRDPRNDLFACSCGNRHVT
jgi:hypothetical protein